ncbi:MAG: EAL domain-containing protein [bacterium]|nr:EAL domain-containing protein [bacterium]
MPTQTTVLMVEDDPPLLELGRRQLEEQSFRVVQASDATAGIEQYLANSPDLVLLDVALPDRSGFDVCETIRSLPGGHSVPVVIVTGMDDAETISRAYSCGATDFAVKPLNWTVLGNRIRLLIDADRASQSLAASRLQLEKAERIARLGTWEFDLTSERMSSSEETARILGIPHAEASPYESLLSSVHPLDKKNAFESFRKMVLELAEIDLEHRVIWPDGSVRTVHHRAQVSRDPGGLAVSVQGVIRDVTDLRRAEEKIQHLANYDRLTGLPNRHMFLELLEGSLARSQRGDRMAAVVYLDMDRFKKINDTLGPEIGDELLISIADRVRISLRKGDVLVPEQGPSVARWGGDKFLVLLSDLEDVGGAAKAVQRLLRQLEIPFSVADRECFLTASAGIAVYPPDGSGAYELLQHAESAMYHAKDLSRNRFQFYSDWMNASSARKLDLENELHKAVVQKELHLVYQPLFDARSERVVGAEALLRWRHPTMGPISPEEFIPIAESAGLINGLGEWVLRSACSQFRSWLEKGLPRIRLSVNLSSYQLREDDFVEKVAQILEETGLDSSLLDVELTERGVALGDETSVRSLKGLKRLGLRVAVDDFGTGNSALSYLKSFPLDILKIDRSFVKGISHGSSDSAIICAVIAMARHLKLEVVAEGVETKAQLDFLKNEGCDWVQGFFFAEPLPPEEFAETFDTLAQSQNRPNNEST